LTPDQRQNFRKAPTSLYPDYYKDNSDTANTVDFRRAIALVDGNFIVELKNLPVTLTGVQIDPDQALEFLKPHPVVKGYILGQFPEDANISLVSPPAGTGMTIAIDSAATPEEGKIAFVITASAPVPDGSQINFRVFNKQNSQTFAQTVSYTTPVPGLEEKTVDAVVGTDKSIELLGTNLIDGVTTLAVFNSGGVASGVKIDNKGVGKNANGDVVLKADLKMSAATAGSFTLKAKNGNLESNPIKFEIKPKPTPNATPKPTPTP